MAKVLTSVNSDGKEEEIERLKPDDCVLILSPVESDEGMKILLPRALEDSPDTELPPHVYVIGGIAFALSKYPKELNEFVNGIYEKIGKEDEDVQD